MGSKFTLNRVVAVSKSSKYMNITVFGAGAWGTAMACYCRTIGHGVTLVPKFEDQAEKIRTYQENVDFLPGVRLPDNIVVTTSVHQGLQNCEIAFLACPSIGFEDLCHEIHKEATNLDKLPILLSLCKGIQNDRFEMASDLIERLLPEFEYGVLAGPTNAREVSQGHHAAMVLATNSDKICSIQESLSSDKMRIYRSNDVKGAELGGCLKNAYAIGAGICDGMGLGDNAKAAFLTRALRELVIIGVALGGHRETFYGLSGLGDFIATCMGKWSRNRTFGEKIAQGHSAQEVLSSQNAAVEGYKTVHAFYELCKKHNIDAPIMSTIYEAVYKDAPISECLGALLHRELKSE